MTKEKDSDAPRYPPKFKVLPKGKPDQRQAVESASGLDIDAEFPVRPEPDPPQENRQRALLDIDAEFPPDE